MTRHADPSADSLATRRATLLLGMRAAGAMAAATLLGGVARAAHAADGTATPAIRFLTRDEGVAAIGVGATDAYYDSMGMQEVRARVPSLPANATLAEARVAVREFESTAVLSFTDDETAALRGVVERMQPRLARRAPLYARTPWSFIKLADRSEGGMPHTRGPHIAIPAAVAEAYAKRHRELQAQGKIASSTFGASLLVHEQTHVLERAMPALFEPLFTEVFGFTRMTPAPSTPWLDAHAVHNPDGPDACWAFPLEKVGGSGWVMPDVTLPDIAHPKMPDNFQSVAVDVEKTASGWRVLEADGRPRMRELDRLPGYHAHFPWPDEDFHPHEIAAVMLSHWILQDVGDLDSRPLIAPCGEWARRALA
jgi:hypothetical protein